MKNDIVRALEMLSSLGEGGMAKLAVLTYGEMKAELEKLRAENKLLKGAADADNERFVEAAEKAGIIYLGCDTPDALADEVILLRADIETLAWICLSHGLISRGKFAALLNIDRCDVDEKLEEIARDRVKEGEGLEIDRIRAENKILNALFTDLEDPDFAFTVFGGKYVIQRREDFDAGMKRLRYYAAGGRV